MARFVALNFAVDAAAIVPALNRVRLDDREELLVAYSRICGRSYSSFLSFLRDCNYRFDLSPEVEEILSKYEDDPEAYMASGSDPKHLRTALAIFLASRGEKNPYSRATWMLRDRGILPMPDYDCDASGWTGDSILGNAV